MFECPSPLKPLYNAVGCNVTNTKDAAVPMLTSVYLMLYCA